MLKTNFIPYIILVYPNTVAYDSKGNITSRKLYSGESLLSTDSFTWVDGKLIGQTDNTNTLRFIYNDNEEIVGFIRNDAEIYLYLKNLLGDVIGIVDETGSVVVTYEYDVWGKLLSASGNQTIGTLNPIRYRGYYYDTESGYYYLESRYYDPELRRFINADKLESLYSPKDTYLYADSVNVFAYCTNSPVQMVDYSGEKEADNTSTYLANVLVFTIVLAGLIDKVVKIASDQTLYKKTSPTTWIYNKSKKGVIKIFLRSGIFGKNKEDAFSDFVYNYYLLFDDKVFDALTTITLNKFEEVFPKAHKHYYRDLTTEKRPFLFSDKCVKNEIKDHCMGYWYCVGKIKEKKYIRKFMQVYSINKKALQRHCQEIDIAEQDVCEPIDRELFDYYNGIREVYKNTLADPYWRKNGKRKKIM